MSDNGQIVFAPKTDTYMLDNGSQTIVPTDYIVAPTEKISATVTLGNVTDSNQLQQLTF
jgi:hypothetical protein